MLTSDEIIYNILTTAKEDGNPLLQHFHIKYPSKDVAREDNNIFVACVSSEPNNELFEATEYRDLVEVLVVTKIRDYKRAITVIKTVVKEIIRLIKSSNEFQVRPVVRNIAPEYNPNFVLTKGHILIEVLTEIEDYNTESDVEKVCKIILKDNIEVD